MSTAAESSSAIADEFTASGFSAYDPAGNGSACLKLANARGALTDLSITSIGTLIWEYRSCDGKGAVGVVAAQHGLQVALSVLDEDTEFFETYAEINVINLARPDRGTVRVNDDGALYWHCCLQSPETDGLTAEDIAATVARALIGADHAP